MNQISLDQLKQMLAAHGVVRLFFKRLSENDNSKNQVYLGPDFSSLNVLPTRNFVADARESAPLKAPLEFSWLVESGALAPAPNAQLILYPQYPEVRFSGFLLGCRESPGDQMRIRQAGRVLFFGISAVGRIVGFVAAHDSALALEACRLSPERTIGIFSEISLEAGSNDRGLLLRELSRISKLGWIDSRRLDSLGSSLPCVSSNCGGYTLEAELGIRPNGFSEPDYLGWEVKQHAVRVLERTASGGPITLMTPEPTGGVYGDEGVREFIRRFGYADRTIADRRNFGGIHSAVKVCAATGLALTLDGYDATKRRITDISGGLTLLNANGESAATWKYTDLLSHWTRKHAKAAYVPSMMRKDPIQQYQFGHRIRLAVGTDFLLFLDAVAKGAVYYDPGIKIENASSAKPLVKKRSQFRVKSSNIPLLYEKVEDVDLHQGWG